VDKGIFLGYFDTTKAYGFSNSRTLVVEESIHVKFNDDLTFDKKLLDLEDDFANMQIGLSDASKENKVKQFNEILSQTKESSNQLP